MRLFLSSYGISNQPDKLVKIIGAKKKVALITNATDYHDELGTLERVERDKKMFKTLGLELERLDLRDYFEDRAGLKDTLLQYGLIWVRGGNAFILRRAMAQSSFDEVIIELLCNDLIAYGGYSAGACVLSPTLHGVELCDDPIVVPESYEREIIWEGLNLVDFSLAPHYKSDHPESEMIDKVVEYYQRNAMPFKALYDGEAILINGVHSEYIK